MPRTPRRLEVALEATHKRTFAVALDWPGWARSGRDADGAIEALVAYAPRYARVVKRAKLGAAPAPALGDAVIAERVKGNATTEFGAPGIVMKADERPLTMAQLQRLEKLLKASWAEFDAAVRTAGSRSLRTGPRGGGRQVPKMGEHVLGAEQAYLAKLGGNRTEGSDDPAAAMRAVRRAFLDVLERVAAGEPPDRVPRSGSLWPPRYAVRRSAWHALDHAWEIEDRLE